MLVRIYILVFVIISLFGCRKKKNEKTEGSGLDNAIEATGITALPDSAHEDLLIHFSKYTNIIASNGKPVHILAESDVSNAKINKVKTVLAFYLNENSNGGEFNKSNILNRMGNNKATMALFSTEKSSKKAQTRLSQIDLNIQDLYASEIVVDGSEEYFATETRDATYEEVLHLIQDYGIKPTYSNYDSEINESAIYAKDNGIWLSPMTPEWEKEGSISTEYFATVMDVYFGLWQHESSGIAFNGEYFYSSREAMQIGDPLGYRLIHNRFVLPYINYNVQVYSDFSDTLHLRLDTAAVYSGKSQYLSSVKLTGTNNIAVTSNQWNNTIYGNSGKTNFMVLGNYNEYEVTSGSPAIVNDLIQHRDGTDTLFNVDAIVFKDTLLQL